jgi:hypothetical protein
MRIAALRREILLRERALPRFPLAQAQPAHDPLGASAAWREHESTVNPRSRREQPGSPSAPLPGGIESLWSQSEMDGDGDLWGHQRPNFVILTRPGKGGRLLTPAVLAVASATTPRGAGPECSLVPRPICYPRSPLRSSITVARFRNAVGEVQLARPTGGQRCREQEVCGFHVESFRDAVQ